MSLFGPSKADILAFKNRLVSNPVVNAVVNYIQQYNQNYGEFAIAVYSESIELYKLYYFQENNVASPTPENSKQWQPCFRFSAYGMAPIQEKVYQEAVADVLLYSIRQYYRTPVTARPYYEIRHESDYSLGYTEYSLFRVKNGCKGEICCYTIDATSPKIIQLKSW